MKGVLLNKTVYNRGHGTASLSVTGSYFDGKKILVGVTAGAAICKATEFVRRLRESASEVSVVMTQNATRLVSPQLFGGAFTDMYDGNSMRHIDWQKHDLICVVPATANLIGKMANGIADDLLTTTILAYKGPVLIAPAMNTAMWENQVVVENVAKLEKRGVNLCGPEEGMLACGDNGWGRMSEVAEILAYAERIVAPKDLKGKNVLVTAGSTREFIDDIRFMANGSSGRMGYSFAKEAWIRGANVVLVSGAEIEDPYDIRIEKVISAEDMFKVVKKHFKWCDYFVSAAAVADFRPVQRVKGKIVKKDGLDVSFTGNVDILKWCGVNKKRNQKIIGFAIGRAHEKFKQKKCDFLVENKATNIGMPCGECVLIGCSVEKSFSGTKGDMAKGVWDEVL